MELAACGAARRKQNLPADLPLALHLETVVVTEHDDEGHGFARLARSWTPASSPRTARSGTASAGAASASRTAIRSSELPDGVEMLTGVLAELEGRLRSAVIVDFEYGPDGLALVGLEQMRRPNARVATSLAVDLAIRGHHRRGRGRAPHRPRRTCSSCCTRSRS